MTSPIAIRYERRLAAQQLALQLMTQHGLSGWTFAFNRRKRGMGLCRYASRTIELSLHLIDRNELDEIRDTILHEIAHALVGPKHGHDAVWKKMCIEIGARPQRCGQADMPAGRWQAQCGGCSAQFHRHRRPRQTDGWFCRQCGPETGRLTWRLSNVAPSGLSLPKSGLMT